MDERVLKTLSKIIDSSRASRCRGEDIGEDRRGRTCTRDGADRLACRQAGVNERVDNDRAVYSPIVNSVAATQAGLAITGYVSRETDSRTKIVFVTGAVASLRQIGIDEERVRKLLIVPAESQIECKTRCNAPVVLSEEGPVDGSQLKPRLTKILLIVCRVAFSGNSG